ncbi:hypothetical protein BH11MYX1_BH11MYX1_42190 [soil metagenome]
MTRLLLPFLLLATACGTRAEDDVSIVPDASPGCPYVGYFTIASPRAELHYSPHLDVHIGSAELYSDPSSALQFSMIEDTGASYAWTSYKSEPPPLGSPDTSLVIGTAFHYELPAGHRFTLTVSYCEASEVQTVEFFTSAE